MKEKTVKAKLSQTLLISVASLLVVVAVCAAYVMKEGQLDAERVALSELDQRLLKLDAEMLQARRNEKDFILRREEKYVTRHAAVMERISGILTDLRTRAEALDIDGGVETVDGITRKLDEYAATFAGFVDLHRQIGLTPDQGLEGAQRAAVHEIETLLEQIGNDELTVKMLMMRRHEKDFIMRVEEKYIDRLNARVSEFQSFPVSAFGSSARAEDANRLLLDYQGAFAELARKTIEERATRTQLSGLYADATPFVTKLRADADELISDIAVTAAETRQLFAAVAVMVTLVSVLTFFVVTLRTSRSIGSPLTAYADALSDLAEGRTGTTPPRSTIVEIARISAALNVLRENEDDRQRLQEKAEASRKSQKQVTDALREGLARLSDGDLAWRIDTPLDPEYEKLRSDYNSAAANLQDVMTKIVLGSDNFRNNANEIAGAADDLAHRTETQAASLEETAAAVEELTNSVKSSSGRADQANQYVSKAQEKAQNSSEVVRETVTAMDQIEDSSNRISQIIGVIDDIAFQTNLLALNAGVEAARAGEAGRGFAVVASEVRGLAQRSSEAAKEIKTLISESATHVERGVDFVGKTGTTLGEIVEMVSNISDLVAEITASSKEQSSGLAEINAALTGLDDVTQRNAAMVQESTAASRALTRQAEELERLTSHFRIEHAAMHPASGGELLRAG